MPHQHCRSSSSSSSQIAHWDVFAAKGSYKKVFSASGPFCWFTNYGTVALLSGQNKPREPHMNRKGAAMHSNPVCNHAVAVIMLSLFQIRNVGTDLEGDLLEGH